MARKWIRGGILFVLFLAVLCLEFWGLNYVLTLKATAGVQSRFARLKRNSVDTVLIGNSHQYCSISPDILNEEYGMNTFMLATSGQTLPMSYYAAMEAIELQHPKRIIFEVCYCANHFRTISDEMSHYFFDGMPLCKAKKLALEDLIEKEKRIYFELPFGIYHSRWKSLGEEDFKDYDVSKYGGFTIDVTQPGNPIPLADPDEKVPMLEEMEMYLGLMIDLCKENNVELILYVAPYSMHDPNSEEVVESLKNSERIFNYVGEYAANRQIEFHNLFYELDEIGLDDATDWMDVQHLNKNGQAKLTRYVAEKGYVR